MKISEALSFPFRGPNVWVNWGCLLVSFLIPIVGPIVASGFLIIAEKRLIQNPLATAPRFDFSKFTVYLQRGIPPFIVSLLAACVLAALLGPVSLLGVFLLFVHRDDQRWFLVLIPILCFVYLAGIMALGVVAGPLAFKAGVEGKIGGGGNWAYLREYLRRVGWLHAGMQLLLLVLFIPFAVVSLCIPLLGPYAGLAVLMQVQAHVSSQLYRLYLERGGSPLKIAAEEMESGGFPVLMVQESRAI